jgi:hypothetical protein
MELLAQVQIEFHQCQVLLILGKFAAVRDSEGDDGEWWLRADCNDGDSELPHTVAP